MSRFQKVDGSANGQNSVFSVEGSIVFDEKLHHAKEVFCWGEIRRVGWKEEKLNFFVEKTLRKTSSTHP
jgi:hypothetical protein